MFGAADLDIRKMKYNILWGILEYDVRFTRFFIRIGHADVRVKYGDTEIAGTVRGNMEFVAVGVGGTAHMWYDYQGIAHIKTINPELRSESIRSDVKVVGSRDYSDQVNNFFNYEILPLYEKYQHEVNTMLGQVIIWGVDWIRSIR
ncbi:uncharacterized protein LOC112057869 [Bicyclus anynana]|uniref:Uncharacterized protein LOC112057869 n=1 Tax=Bicyclus anynana TaxID=110368 RepID=A0A6J1P8Q6_BICAN|nr:uncharacterized protein LOC112057869 [Bicyclus anynana]